MDNSKTKFNVVFAHDQVNRTKAESEEDTQNRTKHINQYLPRAGSFSFWFEEEVVVVDDDDDEDDNDDDDEGLVCLVHTHDQAMMLTWTFGTGTTNDTYSWLSLFLSVSLPVDSMLKTFRDGMTDVLKCKCIHHSLQMRCWTKWLVREAWGNLSFDI